MLSITNPAAIFLCCYAMQSLAQLIVQHSGVLRWLMKIDDEHLGRGHAYLDVAAVPAVATALQLYATTLDRLPGTLSYLCAASHNMQQASKQCVCHY